jgi:maltose alpha-D-glucosyltransferase/alpha-amylase
MRQRRWFRGKARKIKGSRIVDTIEVPMAGGPALAMFFEVDYTEGDPETYLVPVTRVAAEEASVVLADNPTAGIARLGDGEQILVDATAMPAFGSAFLKAIAERRRLRGERGELVGRPERALRDLIGAADEALAATPIRSEQSNSSVVLGQRLIVKIYRAIETGPNPDLEVGRLLTERESPLVPAVGGSLEYRVGNGPSATVAILQQFVPNQGDVFTYTLDSLPNFFERAAAQPEPPPRVSLAPAALLTAAADEPPDILRETIDAYLDTAELLGTRTGELHVALAAPTDDQAFAPEPFSELYQRSVYQGITGTVKSTTRLLQQRLHSLEGRSAVDAEAVLGLGDAVEDRLRGLLTRRLGGMRIRIHGDFHAGQVLHTGRDLVIIDFEGEPARPLGERRLKRSPMRDVAGMLRSFHYAINGAMLRSELGASIRAEDEAALEPWIRAWYATVAAEYLRGYRGAVAGAPFLPTDDTEWAILLDAFLLHKAYYEVAYELNNRPDWVGIPLRGILDLFEP